MAYKNYILPTDRILNGFVIDSGSPRSLRHTA